MNKETYGVCGNCYQQQKCEASGTVSTYGLERSRVTPAHKVGDCFLHVCEDGYRDAVEMMEESFAQALTLFGTEHKRPMHEGPVLGRFVVKRDFGRYKRGDVLVYVQSESRFVLSTNVCELSPK